MLRKLIPAVAVLGIVGTAHAQPQSPENNLLNTTTQGNGNLTKIDGSVLGVDARAMQNPGQTRIQLRGVEGVGNVQVRVKDGDLTNVGNLSDINLQPRSVGNGNVARVDGNIGNIDVRGISTPGTTNVTVRPPK